jgi:hypothetical protein
MNHEDRALLAELRRLNPDVVPLAMEIMDESVTVTAEEQYAFCGSAGGDEAAVGGEGPAHLTGGACGSPAAVR